MATVCPLGMQPVLAAGSPTVGAARFVAPVTLPSGNQMLRISQNFRTGGVA